MQLLVVHYVVIAFEDIILYSLLSSITHGDDKKSLILHPSEAKTFSCQYKQNKAMK